MPESDGGDFNAMDSRLLLYMPKWARRALVIALVAVFMLAAIACVYLVSKSPAHGGAEVLGFVLSLLQGSAAGLIVVVLLLYSRRDANIDMLVVYSDEFLRKHLRRALAKISVPALGIGKLAVRDAGVKDIFGQSLILEAKTLRVPIWVGLNVHRIFVIYYVARDSDPNFRDRVQEIFKFTFGGATQVGFKVNYEEATVDGEPILSIWLSAEAKHDLLTNPTQKLFWSQDIAMMTESFIRTALRNNLNLATRCTPAPL